MDITEFYSWNVQKRRWQAGELVDKDELLEQLNRGIQPPENCLDFVAAMIDGKVKFKNGRRNSGLMNSTVRQMMVAYTVVRLERIYQRRSRNKQKLVGDPTPRELAKEYAAERFRISTRQVENVLSNFGDMAAELYRKK